MKNTVVSSAIGSALLLVAVMPTPAHAIQAHAAPEGLYIHQIGHILFAFAMLGFALRVRQSELYKKKSWRLMSIGAVLFALWNGWAFIAHVLDRMIPQADFSMGSEGLKSILTLHSPVDVLYYLFKMDHLICLPALVFIYLALRRMVAQSAGPVGDEDNLQ